MLYKVFERVPLKELDGKIVHITPYMISQAGYDMYDNPICNLISTLFIEDVSVSIDFIDEAIDISVPWFNYTPEIFTTTALEDWYKDYFNEKEVEPISLFFFTRDYDDVVENYPPDSDMDEDEQEAYDETVNELMSNLWVGIANNI